MTDDRLLELLVERMDRDLVADERQELHRALEAEPAWREDDLELAAAAALLAIAEPTPVELPVSLRERILASAAEAGPRAEVSEATRDASPSAEVIPLFGRTAGVAWVAAAIAASIAVVGWWPTLTGVKPPPEIKIVERPAPPPPPPPTLQERYERLAAAPDVQRIAWAAAGHPDVPKIGGEVIWSQDTQQGFMRFAGLPKNDPTEAQYQLWIFDGERDDRYPVDGGVFDIDAETGEALVAINAKIQVKKPALFAITREPPGGVVVSTREHLLVLAKVL